MHKIWDMNGPDNAGDPIHGKDGISLKISVHDQWIPASTWELLAECAQYGDGRLYFTEHGNIRLRGLSEEASSTLTSRLSSLPHPEPCESTPLEIGWLERDNSRIDLGAIVPLGICTVEIAQILAAIARPTRIGMNNRLLISGLDPAEADAILRVLAPRGLVFDSNSPWTRISSCIGAPHCEHARSRVLVDAPQLAQMDLSTRVHLVGCAEHCKQPAGSHTLYEATGEGEYETKDIDPGLSV